MLCAPSPLLRAAATATDSMSDPHLELAAVLAPDDSASFEEVYAIYSRALPLREQKSKLDLIRLLARSDYRVLVVRRSAIVIGFSVVFAPADEPFCLLEYMAVDAVTRNAGVGTRLFRCVLEDVQAHRGTVPLLLEVDSPRELGADHASRCRRQDFYRRLGCLIVDQLAYALPLAGTGPPPLMDLMLHRADQSRPISKADLRAWLAVVFERVYGTSSRDPRIERMMRPVPDPVRLV